jgi:hypothetical protein
LDQWEPVLLAIVAADGGDQEAGQQAREFLDEAAHDQGWADLAKVLRRVLDGERDEEALLVGLDPIDTAIASRLLNALGGRTGTAEPAE